MNRALHDRPWKITISEKRVHTCDVKRLRWLKKKHPKAWIRVVSYEKEKISRD